MSKGFDPTKPVVRSRHPFEGASRKPPTNKHRPAIWECMLGTVYAQNDAGEVKYFDYRWDEARAFAGVAPDRDPRVAKAATAGGQWKYCRLPDSLRRSQPALWVTE